jgi:MerR family transcriptional regulator, copper efflux regulator
LLDVWQNGGMSIKEQIEIVDRKVKEIAQKKRQLESIETYLVNKLSKLNEEI